MVLYQAGVIRRLFLSIACLDLTGVDIAWLLLLADWSLVDVSFPQLLDGVSLCCADPGSPHFQPMVDVGSLICNSPHFRPHYLRHDG